MLELALVQLPLDKGARGIQKRNFPSKKYVTPKKKPCYLFFLFLFFRLKPLEFNRFLNLEF
jgi:hypothetical protein